MKILHIIDHWGLGGAQRMLSTLIRYDANAEHQVVALFSHGQRPWPLPENGEVGFLGNSYASSVWLPWRLRRLIRRVQPQIIHVHLTGSRFVTEMALFGLGRRRPVLLWHEHSGVEVKSRYGRIVGNGLCMGLRSIARRVDGLSVGSRHLLPFCRQALRIHSDITTILPCPVASEDIHSALQARGDKEGKKRKIIGFVGRFAPQKQPDTFIEVARHCLDHQLVDEAWLVGDGPLRQELEARVRDWGLDQAVKFLGVRDDVYNLIDQLHLVIMPSAYEPFGLVAVEAFVLGKPVVGFAVDGLAEVLGSSMLGHPIPAGDNHALLRRVTDLLHNSTGGERKQRGENPYEAKSVIQDWQVFYQRFGQG